MSFATQMTVRVDDGDARRVADLATRMRLPDAAVLRLLVRAGLEAVGRDARVLLGSDLGITARVPGAMSTREG